MYLLVFNGLSVVVVLETILHQKDEGIFCFVTLFNFWPLSIVGALDMTADSTLCISSQVPYAVSQVPLYKRTSQVFPHQIVKSTSYDIKYRGLRGSSILVLRSIVYFCWQDSPGNVELYVRAGKYVTNKMLVDWCCEQAAGPWQKGFILMNNCMFVIYIVDWEQVHVLEP